MGIQAEHSHQHGGQLKIQIYFQFLWQSKTKLHIFLTQSMGHVISRPTMKLLEIRQIIGFLSQNYTKTCKVNCNVKILCCTQYLTIRSTYHTISCTTSVLLNIGNMNIWTCPNWQCNTMYICLLLFFSPRRGECNWLTGSSKTATQQSKSTREEKQQSDRIKKYGRGKYEKSWRKSKGAWDRIWKWQQEREGSSILTPDLQLNETVAVATQRGCCEYCYKCWVSTKVKIYIYNIYTLTFLWLLKNNTNTWSKLHLSQLWQAAQRQLEDFTLRNWKRPARLH